MGSVGLHHRKKLMLKYTISVSCILIKEMFIKCEILALYKKLMWFENVIKFVALYKKLMCFENVIKFGALI